ncbi:Uma2 family endonuclease [Cohnella soli]|uniref:Uma2 family endonuclease n=1 Tax=Cohnella soli TaxID=425005 RepID=A0ABW0HW68_9BACL
MSEKKKDQPERVREQPMTYDAYAQMPDDGNRYEIFDGVLELMSGPSIPHQVINTKLLLLITQSCDSDYIVLVAPLDVILSQTNVLQPDLIMVHRNRMDIITKRGIEGPPDLIVEVLSPSSHKRDKVRKMQIYARHDVPEYWVIDPAARTLEQYALADGRYTLGNVFEDDERIDSDKLPCVSFVINELFADELLRRLQ